MLRADTGVSPYNRQSEKACMNDSIFFSATLPLFTYQNHMGTIGEGGAKEVGVATVAKFQSAAKFFGFQWEVASGDVGLRDTLQILPKRALIHR